MVHGVKRNTNGAIIVNNYKEVRDVPKDEIMKTPEELQDYIDKLVKGE